MKKIARRKWLIALGLAVVAAFLLASGAPSGFAETDDHNPIGVSGAFEGIITTGCAYNVVSHNARRGPLEDIVVPGAIGKYGLKMTRYYNSRRTISYGLMGPGWSYEYLWISSNDKVEYANGDVWDSHCTRLGLGWPPRRLRLEHDLERLSRLSLGRRRHGGLRKSKLGRRN